MPPATVKAIQAAIEQAEDVLLITHIAPDGDAIGSLTACGLALQQLGKRTTLVCDDGLPERFNYLALADEVQTAPAPGKHYDLLITLDAGDIERLGKAYLVLPQPLPTIINIDHHVTNTCYGQVNLIQVEASATAEVLYHLLPQLGADLTPELAACLLTGLLTDTLGLRTASVTAETLRVAGALVEAGADLFSILSQALILRPVSTLRLWQKGLDNFQIDDGLVWTTLSQVELQTTGHKASGTDGLGNMLSDVYPAVMSAVLVEQADGRINVGFRCRPPYSVSDLARELGGGGHRLASGCTIDGPLDAAETLILAHCRESIQQQRAALANRSPEA